MWFLFLFVFCRGADGEGEGGGHPEHEMYVGETKPGTGGLWRFEQPAFITEGEDANSSLLFNHHE